MANEFKVRKGLIVEGSGSAVLDIQGSQGQLFSITDDLTGDIFSVSDISGVPILNVNAGGTTTIDGAVSSSADGIRSEGDIRSATNVYGMESILSRDITVGRSLKFAAAPIGGSGTKALMFIGNGSAVEYRTLGSNAFNSTSFTTNTGTLTGNGSSGRVPIYNGTTSFTTDTGFTYSSNKLSIDGVLRANGVDIIDHSTARTILIGDTTDSDEIDAIKFVVMAGDNIVLTDGETAVNSALKLPSLSAQNSEATALMKNGSNVVGYRELGSNAFNSTSIPSLSGNVTVGGDLTVSGNQVITAAVNADVKFQVWNESSYGIGMTSGVTLGGLNDYAMTFCMNNDSDRGFWWGYSGQAKSAGAMSLTTGGNLYVSNQVQAQETYIARDSYFERLVYLNQVSENESSTKALVWADDTTIEFRGLGSAAFSSVLTGDGNYGMTTSGTSIRMEDDRRRNSSTTDIYTGNTHDFTWYDADVGIRWYTAGAEEMRLENDGDLHVDGDVIAFSSTVSDERLKDNVTTIENPLDKIKALRGVEYDWNDGSRKGKHDLGLIAQEVEMVIPEIVHEHQMPLLNDDEEDETLYKTVDYEKLTAVLIEGMKEQQNQIDSLKSELAKIKGSL